MKKTLGLSLAELLERHRQSLLEGKKPTQTDPEASRQSQGQTELTSDTVLRVMERMRSRIAETQPKHEYSERLNQLLTSLFGDSQHRETSKPAHPKAPKDLHVLLVGCERADDVGNWHRTHTKADAMRTKDDFSISTAASPDISELVSLMRKHPTQVIHISCHGMPSREPEGWEDRKRVNKAQEAKEFRDVLEALRLVVLQPCQNSNNLRNILNHVPCVIATQRPLPEDKEAQFSSQLYHSLADGRSLAEAYRQALLAVVGMDQDAPEFPRLYHAEGVRPEEIRLTRD